MPSETTPHCTAKTTPTSDPVGEGRICDPGRLVTYTVTAIADPGALPRALELLAKRGLIPLSFTGERVDGQVILTMQIDGLAQAESDHIARCLAMIQLVTTVSVLVERRDDPVSRAA